MHSDHYLIPAATNPVSGDVRLPGSKSIALRQLAIAALTDGVTEIHGVPVCDDTSAMLDCLQALGVQIKASGEAYHVTGPMNFTDDANLNARMSGASTRLLIGLAALRSGKTHIDGHTSLRARTNAPLYDVLREHGCQIKDDSGGLPATIQGPISPPTSLTIDGSLSSQYITALLVAAPGFGRADSQIVISGDLVSRPYIEITLNEMGKRGVQARWLNETTLSVPTATYKPGRVDVEGDATAATYFAALATLHGGDITLTNLGSSSRQGDYGFMQVMEQIGAQVEREPNSTRIVGPKVPNALPDIDMNGMPDAALTLMALAALLPSSGKISGLSSLHHKECDRLECPATEFAKLGIDANTTVDAIVVAPIDPSAIQAHVLNTYHDHRMAMAFSLIGSASGTLAVDDKHVVDKTYPNYWEDFQRVLAA